MPARSLGDDAQAAMLAYAWPGNVRELANALERAVLLSEELVLTAGDLGFLPPDASLRDSRLPGPPRGRRRAGLGGPRAASASAGAQAPEDGRGERAERAARGLARRRMELHPRRDPPRAAAEHAALPRRTPRARRRRAPLRAGGAAGPPPRLAPGWRTPVLRQGRASRGRVSRPAGAPARRVTGAAAARARPPAPPRAPARDAPAVRLLPAPGGRGVSRALEECAVKVQGFGGRSRNWGRASCSRRSAWSLTRSPAARDLRRRSRVRTLAARARSKAAELPEIKVALHTELLAVGRDGDELQLDPGALAGARGAWMRCSTAVGPGSVVASAAAGRFLVRRFDLLPLEGAWGGPPAPAGSSGTPSRGARDSWAASASSRLLRECFELAQAGQGQVV